VKMLNRELKNHKWIYKNNIITSFNKGTKNWFRYDWVRFKSFIRFGISAFDRRRIEDNQALRERVRQLRTKIKELRNTNRELKKATRQMKKLEKRVKRLEKK